MEATSTFMSSTWARASSYSDGARRSPARTRPASWLPIRSPNSSKRARCERAPSYRLMVLAAACKRSQPSGGEISSMETPRARRRSTAAARACCMGASAGTRIQAARCRPASKRPPKPRDQSAAISAAVAVNKPTVSSEGANGMAPSNGSNPKLGLKPQIPQKEAGRRTLPRVCVPNANGTMPAATAAAEPEELPPGVWPGKRGLRVSVASKEAKAVVRVLPSRTPPVRRRLATTGASFDEGSLRRHFHPGVDLGFSGGDAAQTDFPQVACGLLTGVQGLQEFEEHYRYQPSLKNTSDSLVIAYS